VTQAEAVRSYLRAKGLMWSDFERIQRVRSFNATQRRRAPPNGAPTKDVPCTVITTNINPSNR